MSKFEIPEAETMAYRIERLDKEKRLLLENIKALNAQLRAAQDEIRRLRIKLGEVEA